MSFKKNQHYTAEVIDINSQGMGVVRVDNFPFFVEGAITGEEIEFRIVQLKKNFGYGKLIEIIKESPHRQNIIDDKARQLGTMTYQHIKYEEQLEIKRLQVESNFLRIGSFKDVKVLPTIGMEEPFGYRNKGQIPVRNVNGKIETGFFRRGTNDLIPVENFYLQDPIIDETIVKIRNILRKFNTEAYNPKNNKGEIRNIIVKRGYYTGEIMVVLVTNVDSLKNEAEIIKAITNEIEGLVSLMKNINKRKNNVILGNKNELLWGRDYYTDKILKKEFKISTRAFFQVNTQMSEVLYKTGIDLADLKETDKVLDAYCGIGSITLNLAPYVKEVTGVEIVAESVKMAWENKEINNIKNVEFITGKAEEILKTQKDQGQEYDIVFVDPPRKGLDKLSIDSVGKIGPKKIVYISCNPATMARDCKLFNEYGYELGSIQPVDMFPYTHSIEAVTVLEKK